MFTGLIERKGSLERIWREGGGAKIAVAHEPFDGALAIGESIAVQGVCLSVCGRSSTGFVADLLDETLARTAFSELAPGATINLERALRADSRLGGHFVTGHIDETGRVAEILPRGRDRTLRVSCSKPFAERTVMKGSVAIQGVSLTVTGLGTDWLAVDLIPVTLRDTSLGDLVAGAGVHLEADLLGKYVKRLLGASACDAPDDEKDRRFAKTLAEAGFTG